MERGLQSAVSFRHLDRFMIHSDPSPSDKAVAIFREMVGDRADQFVLPIAGAQSIVREALAGCFDEETAADIAFHMTDWNSDLAFIAALHLFPERFTMEEIRDGMLDFLVHASNHVAAAAKLHGWPVQDFFKVGALDGAA